MRQTLYTGLVACLHHLPGRIHHGSTDRLKIGPAAAMCQIDHVVSAKYGQFDVANPFDIATHQFDTRLVENRLQIGCATGHDTHPEPQRQQCRNGVGPDKSGAANYSYQRCAALSDGR